MFQGTLFVLLVYILLHFQHLSLFFIFSYRYCKRGKLFHCRLHENLVGYNIILRNERNIIRKKMHENIYRILKSPRHISGFVYIETVRRRIILKRCIIHEVSSLRSNHDAPFQVSISTLPPSKHTHAHHRFLQNWKNETHNIMAMMRTCSTITCL